MKPKVNDRFDNDAPIGEVMQSLDENGYAVVENVLPHETVDALLSEMEPWIEATPFGPDAFAGQRTKRTGSLVARSATARDLIVHPLCKGVARRVLKSSTEFQLSQTQLISAYPGSVSQKLHKDELVWDFFPFAVDHHVMCQFFWALTDFTEENGATRVAPGSDAIDPDDLREEDTIPVEMSKGSVFIFNGKVVHGGGTNRSDQVRQGLILSYCAGWVRQEENQYLVAPPELARTFSEDVLKMIGYQQGCFAMGYAGDIEEPMDVLFGRKAATPIVPSDATRTAANERAQRWSLDVAERTV
ncbi:phytanoyl-CoA dioxygenase [Streptomyces viridosporus ATCC 14672]|uniref:Phytanoyl-CoA dioxygenase n=1 Tax=Streptomyces viridosporus (strain ATCC 14672 / DSM 40746 / JCM 4963 / KCTC 9882 / NRRL B-12104 / FH 1290) TaxID=566461 RepID=D6A8Q3_STRV1|nr:phytanoyl-CoA dioxygenase family protein [Streptomyces viridosporus]EFE72036.1 phytanoyl-CoA dioxygenase [Streptomyces viridosporus ATCC 14672]